MRAFIKTGFCLVLILIIFTTSALAQEAEFKGKPITEIFTDFHYVINDTTKTSGFGINRAYLGYQFMPVGNISSRVILNVGTPLDLAAGSIPRRYATFREASVTYTEGKISIDFGIANTRMYEFQQKFWGKRYVAQEFLAMRGFGTLADLGFLVDYKINDHITLDLSVMNGEGYQNIQIDNNLKYALGAIFQTHNQYSFKVYGDIMNTGGLTQTTIVSFAGKKGNHYSIGVEAGYKSNIDLTEGHNSWGISGLGSVIIDKKSEIFVRYDHNSSNKPAGGFERWNYLMDGSFSIIGYQFTVNQYFRFALDYQATLPSSSTRDRTHGIFLNLHFKY